MFFNIWHIPKLFNWHIGTFSNYQIFTFFPLQVRYPVVAPSLPSCITVVSSLLMLGSYTRKSAEYEANRKRMKNDQRTTNEEATNKRKNN